MKNPFPGVNSGLEEFWRDVDASTLDHKMPPNPPLPDEEAVWARRLP